MSFDLVVLGCGGGPDEKNLSAYLLKSCQSKWKDGVLAIEAGSGIGALRDILAHDPFIFQDDDGDRSLQEEAMVEDLVEGIVTPIRLAARVYSWIRTFLVSHAHLDHINGLFIGAGSTSSPAPRYIAGLESVIHDIEGVFNGQKLWPRLARHKGDPFLAVAYVYDPIIPRDSYRPVAPNISTTLFPITHGFIDNGIYESTAFFIRNDITNQEFLFLGDVEPDSLSRHPQTRAVWQTAAPKILESRLDYIFLECSWRNNKQPEELYGHLSPKYVVEELVALAEEVVNARRTARAMSDDLSLLEDGLPLANVTVVVIHCKEALSSTELGLNNVDIIVREIEDLLGPVRLGVSVIAAHQGMHIRF